MTGSGLESLLTGRTLCDRYAVGPVIGRGGMGVVYQGTDLRLQRQVAIKVLSLDLPDRRAEAVLRARLAREGRIAAGIRHPNVVAIFDQGTDPVLQLDFLVMELLEGEDLARRVRRAGFPSLDSAMVIFRSAAAGLEAGHRAGLVHRDVKPANLFLESGARSGSPTLKVLDFGIAQVGPDADLTMTVAGGQTPAPLSPAFASLEQLSGASRLTPASDVFSLGAIVFYLIQGRRAFRSTNATEARAELEASLVGLRGDPRIPPAVAEFLERCLAADPAGRYRDAGELLLDLQRGRGYYPELAEHTVLLPFDEPISHSAEIVPDGGEEHSVHRAGIPNGRPSWLLRTVEKILPALLAASAATGLFGIVTGSGALTLLSVSATTIILPWYLHRRRRRGSARFAIIATAVITILGLILLRGELTQGGAFLFLTVVQWMMASIASWLSSPPPAPPSAPVEAPSSNVHDQW